MAAQSSIHDRAQDAALRDMDGLPKARLIDRNYLWMNLSCGQPITTDASLIFIY
jgi:hypothetical protein